MSSQVLYRAAQVCSVNPLPLCIIDASPQAIPGQLHNAINNRSFLGNKVMFLRPEELLLCNDDGSADLCREGCGEESCATTLLDKSIEGVQVYGKLPDAAAHSFQGGCLYWATLDNELPVRLGQRLWPHHIGIHDLDSQHSKCLLKRMYISWPTHEGQSAVWI